MRPAPSDTEAPRFASHAPSFGRRTKPPAAGEGAAAARRPPPADFETAMVELLRAARGRARGGAAPDTDRGAAKAASKAAIQAAERASKARERQLAADVSEIVRVQGRRDLLPPPMVVATPMAVRPPRRNADSVPVVIGAILGLTVLTVFGSVATLVK